MPISEVKPEPVSQSIPRERVTRTDGISLRCMWVVQAGVVPGCVIPELTRQWVLTSEAFYLQTGPQTFCDYRQAAYEYAKNVCDPSRVNWVNVEFIYF